MQRRSCFLHEHVLDDNSLLWAAHVNSLIVIRLIKQFLSFRNVLNYGIFLGSSMTPFIIMLIRASSKYAYFERAFTKSMFVHVAYKAHILVMRLFCRYKSCKLLCFICHTNHGNLFTTIHDGNFRRHSSMNVTIKWHKFSSNIYYIYVFFVIWSWKLR